MTPQEAIEIITNAIQTDNMTAEQDKALAMAQKALEKQIPKKFETYTYYPEDKICPICYEDFTGLDCLLESGEKYKFCPACGQALDWGDEE